MASPVVGRGQSHLPSSSPELPPRDLKGFRSAVKAYEVPWRPPGAPPLEEEFSTAPATDTTSVTGFIQRWGG